MAKLVEPYDGLPTYDSEEYDNYTEYVEEEQEAMNKLKKESNEKDGLEGEIVKFRRADGYAYYRVVKEDPLKIQHIPYGDPYKIPKAHVRGLIKEDIREHKL